MPIEFYCPGCGNLMRTPDETAGRKGRCPTCQLKIQIPASSVAATSSETAVRRSAVAASPPGTTPELIRFDCGGCGKTLSIAAANAGKKGQCPHCGVLMSIPRKSPAAGQRWKGLPPIPSERPAPTPRPQGKPTAATPGLTPLPSSAPVSSALTPLEPLGLTPLGPAGSGVLGDDLLGGDPFGLHRVDDGNPFATNATPRAASMRAPTVTARRRQEERTGAEIATMICGGLLIIYAVAQLGIVLVTFVGGTGTFYAPPELRERLADDPGFAAAYAAGKIAAVVLSGIVMLTILAGGIQLIRFKAWGLCLAACILTMVPCNCFCLLGLPIGIWGTTMLSLGAIRSAFR